MDTAYVKGRILSIEKDIDKEDIVDEICSLHKNEPYDISDTGRFMLRVVFLCFGAIPEPLALQWNSLVAHVSRQSFRKWLSNFIVYNRFDVTKGSGGRQFLNLSNADLDILEAHHVELCYIILRLHMALFA